MSDVPAPGRTFRSLARMARRQHDDALRDLDDENLARTALGRGKLDTDDVRRSARQELLRRCEFQMVKHASKLCSRLGNRGHECCGLQCPCLPGCHGVLESALADFATRLTGVDYEASPLRPSWGESLFVETAPRHARRRSAASSTVARWCDRPTDKRHVELVPYFVGELGLSGTTTDARRRWNGNRGLRVRANMPRSVRDEAAKRLIERPELLDQLASFGTRGAGLARDATVDPAKVIEKLTDMLYDDACEAADATGSLIDVDRLARYLGVPSADTEPAPDGDAPRRPDLSRFLQAIDDILSEASEAAGSTFYADHFDRARAARPVAPCLGRP